jgi:hypothetical protein
MGIVDESSSAPLRILVTRQTERDRIIDVQYQLASMGYIKPQKFTGRLGAETVAAIKAFQKANGMSETGKFDSTLAKQVYKIAGKEESPEGHLFVRQHFRAVFDVAIAFQNPEQPLGTHLFTALFAAGDSKSRWMGISLEGDDAVRVLDRIEIPTEIRRKIAEKLTPGSSLIVADKSMNSAVLPKARISWCRQRIARSWLRSLRPNSNTSGRRKPKPSAAKSRRAETRWAAPRHSHAETHGTEDSTDLIASRRQIVRGCFTAGAGAGVVEWPAEWRIRR